MVLQQKIVVYVGFVLECTTKSLEPYCVLQILFQSESCRASRICNRNKKIKKSKPNKCYVKLGEALVF